jgi:hypothetical protein
MLPDKLGWGVGGATAGDCPKPGGAHASAIAANTNPDVNRKAMNFHNVSGFFALIQITKVRGEMVDHV